MKKIKQNFNVVKNDIVTYGLGGTLLKSTLTEEAQNKIMPIIAQKRVEKEVRKEEKQKNKKNDEDDLNYLGAYLQKQDGIERDIREVDGNKCIVKVASKDNLYDSSLKQYGVKMKNHDLIRKDFSKLVVYIKLHNTYARVFNAKRLDNSEVLLDLNEQNVKNNIPDYVVLK